MMKDHNTIGMPLGSRLHRIIRLEHGWRLWTATRDYKYGTYLTLYDNGRITNTTEREGEGIEEFEVRPSDMEIDNDSD